MLLGPLAAAHAGDVSAAASASRYRRSVVDRCARRRLRAAGDVLSEINACCPDE
jgi:hypothetical protein